MNIYQIDVRSRHRRYLFFVDSNIDYENLYWLVRKNQSFWGGRYNPIIPVENGTIAEGYLALIKLYDPDVIFYAPEVNLEMLKKLGFFNPECYSELEFYRPNQHMTGVNVYNLLTRYPSSRKVMHLKDSWPAGIKIESFYTLNFGLSPNTYYEEAQMSSQHVQLFLEKKDLVQLSRVIAENNPINIASLSRANINTKIIRGYRSTNPSDFEIVISKEDNQTNDLFYYWNRGLYEYRNILYITVEQLDEIDSKTSFGEVIYKMKGNEAIKVVSTSLNKSQIEMVIEKYLKPISYYSTFRYHDISSFPYEIMDDKGISPAEYGEQVTTQVVVTENGIIHIPKLSFGNNNQFSQQCYVLDLNISKDIEYNTLRILFPLTTESRFIVKDVPGRVRLNRNLSIFYNNQHSISGILKISIPTFDKLVNQLICTPKIHGEMTRNKILDVRPHDASNKLRAFLNIFKCNFSDIDDYFSEKYWVDIFEELCVSEKSAGDSITFSRLYTKALVAFEKEKLAFVEREEGWLNKDNLSLGLKRALTQLTFYKVFLKGLKLKCRNCSSIFWYPIIEVGDEVKCRGCLEKFNLPVEPEFAYKLNDLVRNNMFSTSESRDGNLTVIRTLAALSARSLSFQYSPQLNLYDKMENNKPFTDLDIVANEDGYFIIGEAKHNSKLFSEDKNKSLKSIAEITQLIRPDKIILACSIDEHGRLENAKKSLEGYLYGESFQPKIETIQLHEPDYRNLSSYRYFKH